MVRRIPVELIFFVGLILMFFLDGSVSLVFSNELYAFPNAMVPYLTVLWLMLSMIFIERSSLRIGLWAAVIGFIFDMYYTGLLGVFVFIFPLVIYLGRLIFESLPPNFFSSFLVYFIMITLVEGISCLANVVVGLVDISIADFLVNILAPTLALNLVLFAILYFPIERLYRAFNR